MARRCGPNIRQCGMSQGIYNPFFQGGAPWYGAGSGGGVPANGLVTDPPESQELKTDDGDTLVMDL